jgi:DNA polymerase-3 subunit gamma/tau
VQLFYQIAVTGRRDLPIAPTPRAGFEMTLLRMLAFNPADAKPATPNRKPETGKSPVPQSAEPRRVAPATTAAVTTTATATAPAVQPSDWSALIETAQLKGPAGQLARNAALIGIENSVVRLALNPAYEHMNAPPVVANIEERLSMALGRGVKLRFEKAGAAQDTPADAAQRERAARQQAAERALGEDPFVQAVIRDFDARVIPESVKPAVQAKASKSVE